MSIVRYFRQRFMFWGIVVGAAVLVYWLAIYVSRPIDYRRIEVPIEETSEGGLRVQLPNFSIVSPPQCLTPVPKYIASPSWAAVQEVWLRGEECTVVIRSFTYERRGDARRTMERWISELMKDRVLLQESTKVCGHPALKLSAPGILHLFVVWDNGTKLLQFLADGCRDEEHKQCLRKLIASIELR
jgi:hypothetical protein